MATILTCRFENCFGITKMDHTFCFDENKNVFIIYAKNGLMKTSFTEIFSKIREDKTGDIKDRIFKTKSITHICKDQSCKKDESCKNQWKFNKDSLYVIKSMDVNYQSESLPTLLVRKTDKQQFDKFLELKKIFLKSLEEKSGIEDSESLEEKICTDLGIESIFELGEIQNQLSQKVETQLSKIKYDKIDFNIISKREFQSNINEFIKKNNEIYEKHGFLEKGKFSFVELKDIADKLESNNFFVNDNKIWLNNDIVIKDNDDLKKKINEIQKDIEQIPALSKIYDLLDNKKQLYLKKIIESDVEFIKLLKNKKELQKQFWISYIKENEQIFNELKDKFEYFQKEIKNYQNTTVWDKSLKIFEKRFYVPFKMHISNKDFAELGLELPKVEFLFKNNDDKQAKHKPGKFEKTLSQGERRALYLLNVIFDIEELKIKNPEGEKIIIVDDIADSFDYKNKYAILEYLVEISEIKGVRLIILTHNFDFYRAVNLRLTPQIKGKLFATKQENEIKLENFPLNIDDKIFFLDWMKDFNERNFIALIPYVRNIIEFTNNKKHISIKSGTKKDYGILSNALHTKEISKNQIIKYEDIAEIFKKHINIDIDCKVIEKLNNDKCDIWDKIYLEADKIVSDKFSSFNLKEELKLKIILSIAARLKSEKYMIDKYNNNKNKKNKKDKKLSNTELDKNNDIHKLLKLCVDEEVIKENDEDWSILKRVSIITPENIHINSFMFEPLIDIEFNDLKKLYKKVSDKLK